MAEAPLFSVVVPTHNRAGMIPRCLDTILAQEPGDLEVVVVDDGSRDATREVVEGYGDDRIRYLYQEPAGANRARNAGAAAAGGRYLIFMDDDDEALPTWLQRLGEAATDAPAAVCCGQLHILDGKVVRTRMPVDMGPQFHHLQGRFNPGTYALRRDAFAATGGFREDLEAGQHTEMALRFADLAHDRGWKVAFVDEPLVLHHLHAGPRIRKDPGAVRRGAERILELHGPRILETNPRVYANYCALIAINAARQGDYAAGRRALVEAIRARPADWRHYVRLLAMLARSVAGGRPRRS